MADALSLVRVAEETAKLSLLLLTSFVTIVTANATTHASVARVALLTASELLHICCFCKCYTAIATNTASLALLRL